MIKITRRPFLAGNWKMNKTSRDADQYMDAFIPLVKDIISVDITLCAPFTHLPGMNKKIQGTNIKIASQNMYFEEKGAYTGEISPNMVKEFCSHVIIGHSERRKYFNETDEILNKKIKKALEYGLKIIFCVGETLDENEKGMTKEVLKKQIENGLLNVDEQKMKNIVIAYEPVWAIGTGKTATPEYAQDVHSYIRNLIKQIYSKNTSDEIRIIYGGSVKPNNIQGLISKEDIDGALPGGASLDPVSFSEIIKKTI